MSVAYFQAHAFILQYIYCFRHFCNSYSFAGQVPQANMNVLINSITVMVFHVYIGDAGDIDKRLYVYALVAVCLRYV